MILRSGYAILSNMSMNSAASVMNTDFLWMALRSSFCQNQFEIETGGIGKGEISEDRLMAIMVPKLSLNAQNSIVKYWQAAQAEI